MLCTVSSGRPFKEVTVYEKPTALPRFRCADIKQFQPIPTNEIPSNSCQDVRTIFMRSPVIRTKPD